MLRSSLFFQPHSLPQKVLKSARIVAFLFKPSAASPLIYYIY